MRRSAGIAALSRPLPACSGSPRRRVGRLGGPARGAIRFASSRTPVRDNVVTVDRSGDNYVFTDNGAP